jgi:hypothetical protein
MNYVIRAAQPADNPQLTALRTQCNERKMGNRDVRHVARDINANLPIHNSTVTLVYEQGGILLGFVLAAVQPLLPLAGTAKTTWTIIEFCVPDLNAQEQVGSALLQEISRQAEENAGYVTALW